MLPFSMKPVPPNIFVSRIAPDCGSSLRRNATIWKSYLSGVTLICGAGESHRLTRLASANAAKTFSGRAASRRRISATSVLGAICLILGKHAFELIDRAAPEDLVAGEPALGVP